MLKDVLKLTGTLLWEGSKFTVKHTPKAIVAIANAKRELVNAAEESINKSRIKHKKELKEYLLDVKIEQIKQKAKAKKSIEREIFLQKLKEYKK